MSAKAKNRKQAPAQDSQQMGCLPRETADGQVPCDSPEPTSEELVSMFFNGIACLQEHIERIDMLSSGGKEVNIAPVIKEIIITIAHIIPIGTQLLIDEPDVFGPDGRFMYRDQRPGSR
jgi:hypothetical protein